MTQRCIKYRKAPTCVHTRLVQLLRLLDWQTVLGSNFILQDIYKKFQALKSYLKISQLHEFYVPVCSYGLDGQEIKSRYGRDFPYLSRSALDPHSLLHNG